QGGLVLASGRSHVGDPSGSGFWKVVGPGFFPQSLSSYLWHGYNQVEKLQPATVERGTRRRVVLLQTLRTGDFDELTGGVPRWDLRFRQLGRGPFQGHLQFLQLGAIQVFRVSVNRMVHVEGWPPPGSFGFGPVLPANAGAIWRGRR